MAKRVTGVKNDILVEGDTLQTWYSELSEILNKQIKNPKFDTAGIKNRTAESTVLSTKVGIPIKFGVEAGTASTRERLTQFIQDIHSLKIGTDITGDDRIFFTYADWDKIIPKSESVPDQPTKTFRDAIEASIAELKTICNDISVQNVTYKDTKKEAEKITHKVLIEAAHKECTTVAHPRLVNTKKITTYSKKINTSYSQYSKKCIQNIVNANCGQFSFGANTGNITNSNWYTNSVKALNENYGDNKTVNSKNSRTCTKTESYKWDTTQYATTKVADRTYRDVPAKYETTYTQNSVTKNVTTKNTTVGLSYSVKKDVNGKVVKQVNCKNVCQKYIG